MCVSTKILEFIYQIDSVCPAGREKLNKFFYIYSYIFNIFDHIYKNVIKYKHLIHVMAFNAQLLQNGRLEEIQDLVSTPTLEQIIQLVSSGVEFSQIEEKFNRIVTSLSLELLSPYGLNKDKLEILMNCYKRNIRQDLTKGIAKLVKANLDNAELVQRVIDFLTFKRVSTESYDLKRYFRTYFSWSIPSYEAVRAIRDFVGTDSVLEVCGGLGLWGGLLRAAGVEITVTDSFTSHGSCIENTFTDVIPMDAVEAVKTFRTPVLFISWPNYNNPIAANALQAFKGNKLVYIGEGPGGCSPDDAFFELLDNFWVDSEYPQPSIPQWYEVDDYLCIFERK